MATDMARPPQLLVCIALSIANGGCHNRESSTRVEDGDPADMPSRHRAKNPMPPTGPPMIRGMLPDRSAPEGYHTVTPRMVVADVAGAVQFLRAAFEARVTSWLTGPPRYASATHW
jgi:hypothetical protein